MTHQEVEKYRKPTRVIHWIHAGAFLLLFITGLIMFIPGLSALAEGGWTRLVHRIGAAIFVIIPILYLVINPKSVGRGFKQAFTWGSGDMGWLKAAPRYYFLGDTQNMPPQGIMNTGQKLWWLITIVFGVISAITGAGLWFAKTSAPPEALQRMTLAHDIAFIVTGCIFLIHIYLGVFHPAMTESWKAMTSGKISTDYAKARHGKWYAEISKGKKD